MAVTLKASQEGLRKIDAARKRKAGQKQRMLGGD